ncbi:MAG: hypothetical protein AAF202_03320 [Pseudomonadota bacterium]
MKIVSTVLIFCIYLFPQFAHTLSIEEIVLSNQKVFESCGNVHLAYERETDFVLLQRDLSVSGERICHDGRQIFFKDNQVCEKHNEIMSEHGIEPVACDGKPLAPLKGVEQINMPEGEKLFRFFAVDIYYEMRLRGVSETCSTETVEIEKIIEVCDSETHPTQWPETIWSERDAVEGEEAEFLNTLVTSGFGIFNAPAGHLDSLLFSKPRTWDFLSNGQPESVVMRSPQCDPEFQELFHRAGGEFTGTSRELMDPFKLETYSSPLLSDQLTKQSNTEGKIVKSSTEDILCNYETDISIDFWGYRG